VATLKGLEGIFQNTLSVVLGIAGIALFITLVMGGFQYMTAGGDPKKVAAAWTTLTYAVVGMILVASSYLILVFIQEFTGAPGILDFVISP
jgi:hypothetical protein